MFLWNQSSSFVTWVAVAVRKTVVQLGLRGGGGTRALPHNLGSWGNISWKTVHVPLYSCVFPPRDGVKVVQRDKFQSFVDINAGIEFYGEALSSCNSFRVIVCEPDLGASERASELVELSSVRLPPRLPRRLTSSISRHTACVMLWKGNCPQVRRIPGTHVPHLKIGRYLLFPRPFQFIVHVSPLGANYFFAAGSGLQLNGLMKRRRANFRNVSRKMYLYSLLSREVECNNDIN